MATCVAIFFWLKDIITVTKKIKDFKTIKWKQKEKKINISTKKK